VRPTPCSLLAQRRPQRVLTRAARLSSSWGAVAHAKADGYTVVHSHPRKLNGTKFFQWGYGEFGRFQCDFLSASPTDVPGCNPDACAPPDWRPRTRHAVGAAPELHPLTSSAPIPPPRLRPRCRRPELRAHGASRQLHRAAGGARTHADAHLSTARRRQERARRGPARLLRVDGVVQGLRGRPQDHAARRLLDADRGGEGVAHLGAGRARRGGGGGGHGAERAGRRAALARADHFSRHAVGRTAGEATRHARGAARGGGEGGGSVGRGAGGGGSGCAAGAGLPVSSARGDG
jgi:hypothetical protein